MHRFVVTARLRPGSTEEVAAILREGPPFDIDSTSLERHEVFLGDDELVFLFEGIHAEQEARRLLATKRVLGAAGRIGSHLAERPRMPHEAYVWERPSQLDGVSYGAQPGPGDSDGGASD